MKKKIVQRAPRVPRVPRLPAKLPASWGRGRVRFYEALLRTVRGSTAPEEILLASLIAVRFLEEQCPRAGDSFLNAAWAAIRDWHSARPDNIGSGVPCPQCGERRYVRFIGEGRVISHAMVSSIEPPVAHVIPNNCDHSVFAINCRTCGAEVTTALNPVVDLTAPSEAKGAKDYSLN